MATVYETEQDRTIRESIVRARHLARTDLYFLCKYVLGYDLIDPEVHGPFMDKLVNFADCQGKDYVDLDQGICRYTPRDPDPINLVPDDLKRRRLVMDPRGWFKCLRLGSLVSTAAGEYKKVENLQVGERLRCIDDETYELRDTKITGLEPQGEQECYKIRFRSGKTVEVSHNHPFRTIEGWVKTEDLIVKDRIASLGRTPEPRGAQDLPWARICGWFVGDGSFSNQSVTNGNASFRADIQKAVQEAGGTASESFFQDRTPCVRVRGLRPLWRQLGLLDKMAGDKFAPAELFQASNNSVRQFLWALYMSDGTCGDSGIFLTTKSERLAFDVQRLLRRFNIWSFVRTHNGFWRVAVTSQPQIERFRSSVGWDKEWRFREINSSSNPNFNTVPKGWRDFFPRQLFRRGTKPDNLPVSHSWKKYDASKERLRPLAKALKAQWLENLCSDDIYWDEIIEVENIGYHETIAVETSTGNFGLDDIVTHNTTINVIGHTIQLLLNFPRLSILLVHAKSDIIQEKLEEIKGHFAGTMPNSRLKELFPEFCVDNMKHLGISTELRLPNGRGSGAGAPNIAIASATSATGGLHYHWIKFSDIVEFQNSRTDEQIDKIKKTYAQYLNLLIAPRYFVDVEGTCYDYNDLYNEGIIEKEEKEIAAGYRSEWEIFVRGCFVKAPPPGETETFKPEERDWPYKLDSEGRRISRFPSHASLEALEKEERNDSWDFACQKLNHPVAANEGDRPFPPHLMQMTPVAAMPHIPMLRYEMAVDTAEKITLRADYTAIVCAGIDRWGRRYIVDADMGKWLPEDTAKRIFQIARKWNVSKIRIEESSFNRGLQPTMKRQMDLTGRYFHFDWLKRDTSEAKKERILSLQPLYKAGTIRFSEGLSPYIKEQYLRQFSRFPTGHDDLIDATADLLQGVTYFGPEGPRPISPAEVRERAFAEAERLGKSQLEEALYGRKEGADYLKGLGSL